MWKIVGKKGNRLLHEIMLDVRKVMAHQFIGVRSTGNNQLGFNEVAFANISQLVICTLVIQWQGDPLAITGREIHGNQQF